jgi:hypothetical protein
MPKLIYNWGLLAGSMLMAAGPAWAQDNAALINVLIRKGILTNQELEEARADAMRSRDAARPPTLAAGKSTQRLSVGMLVVSQFAGFDAEVENGDDPAATNHVFMRRVVLRLKADLSAEWSALFAYNFAGPNFGAAIAEWKPGARLTFDFGLRKVNLGYESRAPSDDINAIEVSPVTRYFVEPNNGRRLGAASYRIGAFVDGRQGPVVYGAAVTNPERIDEIALVAGSGNGANNRPALWGNIGVTGEFSDGGYLAGVGGGFLPVQGGPGAAHRGEGHDLSLYTAYFKLDAGRFHLMAEYLMAQVEAGAALTRSATPRGFYIRPSFMITEKLEAVARYSFLDSDGRGVDLADAVRSAPGGGTMDQLSELYFGGNWYLNRNDLKFSLGALYAKSRNALNGDPAEAAVYGLRSQMQVNF